MTNNDKITLGHGSGGQLTHDLIEKLIVPRFDNPALEPLGDSALLPGRLAFTTDSYVVSPLFFPGGDIGKLAVCGTVNDLAVAGARPRWISCGLIIEEGFETAKLERIVGSMAATARGVGAQIVTGDTKVVERGSADGLFINTAGVGELHNGFAASHPRPGDAIIVSGTIGDHEAAIFHAREQIAQRVQVESDCAALWPLVETMMERHAGDIRLMHDPTRGGLATILCETAAKCSNSFELDEAAVPVRREVAGLCELVGFDPLYMACEGRLVAVVAVGAADAIVQVMREHPLGVGAAVVGRVLDEAKGMCYLKTSVGGSRVLRMLAAQQLPRIC